jgi:hypothetical protein
MTATEFAETWGKLGAMIELAVSVIDAGPDALAALFAVAREGIGTEGERSLLLAMFAIKQAAAVQVEIADRVAAMVEAVAKHADEAALAELTAGASH